MGKGLDQLHLPDCGEVSTEWRGVCLCPPQSWLTRDGSGEVVRREPDDLIGDVTVADSMRQAELLGMARLRAERNGEPVPYHSDPSYIEWSCVVLTQAGESFRIVGSGIDGARKAPLIPGFGPYYPDRCTCGVGNRVGEPENGIAGGPVLIHSLGCPGDSSKITERNAS